MFVFESESCYKFVLVSFHVSVIKCSDKSSLKEEREYLGSHTVRRGGEVKSVEIQAVGHITSRSGSRDLGMDAAAQLAFSAYTGSQPRKDASRSGEAPPQ